MSLENIIVRSMIETKLRSWLIWEFTFDRLFCFFSFISSIFIVYIHISFLAFSHCLSWTMIQKKEKKERRRPRHQRTQGLQVSCKLLIHYEQRPANLHQRPPPRSGSSLIACHHQHQNINHRESIRILITIISHHDLGGHNEVNTSIGTQHWFFVSFLL